MRWRCNVETWKAKSSLNKDDWKCYREFLKYIVSLVICAEKRTRRKRTKKKKENAFVCWTLVFTIQMQKLWENWTYRHSYEDTCSPGLGCRVGVVDRLGSGHQSCDSCKQRWCKWQAERSSCPLLPHLCGVNPLLQNVPQQQVDICQEVHSDRGKSPN